jgi:hypothetical protein
MSKEASMVLSKDLSLYWDAEDTKLGSAVMVDYTELYENPNKQYMVDLLLKLTNWKSNSSYPIVDFNTVTDTNLLYIVTELPEKDAARIIASYFEYTDCRVKVKWTEPIAVQEVAMSNYDEMNSYIKIVD